MDMEGRMRNFIIAAMLLIGSIVLSGAVSAEQVVAGEYVMQGKGVGPADSAYSGTCTFKPNNTLYDVWCYNVDTRHTYSGKGIRTGDYFAIIIGDHLKGDHQESYVGEYLVTYMIAADGRMTGRWIHALSGASGNETLTPKK